MSHPDLIAAGHFARNQAGEWHEVPRECGGDDGMVILYHHPDWPTAMAHQSINPLCLRTGTLTSRTASAWTITLTFDSESAAMAAYRALPAQVAQDQQGVV